MIYRTTVTTRPASTLSRLITLFFLSLDNHLRGPASPVAPTSSVERPRSLHSFHPANHRTMHNKARHVYSQNSGLPSNTNQASTLSLPISPLHTRFHSPTPPATFSQSCCSNAPEHPNTQLINICPATAASASSPLQHATSF